MITHTQCRLWAITVVLAATSLFGSTTARADGSQRPFLDVLFTDNMVLQRGISDPVWGWTTPGAVVKVRVAGKSAVARAGADGEWMAHLPKLPVGGPYTLTVAGQQTATLSNVMVGDVWICSGQSNMEFGVGNLLDPQSTIAAANDADIRLFTVQKTTALTPQQTTVGQWAVCTPATIQSQGTWNGFSAVGYFFGRDLQQHLHIPIGLLLSSWGGTPAEAWTSGTALIQHMPDVAPAVEYLSRVAAEPLTDQAQLAASWYKANDPGSATPLGWADPAYDASSWMTLTAPGYFQQAGVPALAGVNGIAWYRKTVEISADDVGKPAMLHLLADDNDTTWINGTQVGYTEGYQVNRAYPVTPGVLHQGSNVIAVRVLDTGGNGGIYGDPSGLRLDVTGGPSIALAGPWQFRLSKTLSDLPSVPQNVVGNPNYPTELYNGMISPLIPFGIKGAIWYQGEANAGNAYQYRTLLPTMITDWRDRWGGGTFPFLIVQLAGWEPGGTAWAELREAQAIAANSVPDAGIATAIDVGDQSDIHPKNKEEVGRRLALVAEAQVYGEKVPSSGPVYAAMQVQGGAVALTFHDVDGGLVAKGGGPLSGFTIAGADRSFVPADAKIVGSTVIVSSSQVAAPVAVRYAWTGYPAINLYNAAGLPAFPFRTDSWPGVTEHDK